MPSYTKRGVKLPRRRKRGWEYLTSRPYPKPRLGMEPIHNDRHQQATANITDYTPLEDEEIRLINFGAGPGEPILIRTSLRNPWKTAEYTALSYCWGAENCKHLWKMNGQSLVITSSLYVIFQSLQQRGFKGLLWADAICIHQDDLEEKRRQIPLMGKIYSGAQRVIAWLGMPSEEYDLKADSFDIFVDRLVTSRYEAEPNADFDDLVTELRLPPLYSKLWTALGDMLGSPWGTRLWTIQEALLSEKLTFMFGPIEWEFELMSHIADLLDDMNAQQTLNMPVVGEFGIGALSLFPLLHAVAEEFHAGEMTPFDILEYAQGHQVTWASDMIYGLYNLVDFQDFVPVDFSAPASRVYSQAMKACVKLEPDFLKLLSLAGARPKMAGLPSWVPDFTIFGLPKPMDAYARRFAAGLGGRNAEPVISMDDTDQRLGVMGFVLDQIESIVPLDWVDYLGDGDEQAEKAKHNLEGLIRCKDLTALVLQHLTPAERKLALCRTLVADMPAVDTDIEKCVVDADMKLFDKIVSVLDVMSGGDDDWAYGDAYDLDLSVDHILPGMCFFSTRKGRIGIGPSHAELGDDILILFGGHMPHVARRRPDGVCHEYLGTVYVNGEGIMEGEALRKHEREWAPDEEFWFD